MLFSYRGYVTFDVKYKIINLDDGEKQFITQPDMLQNLIQSEQILVRCYSLRQHTYIAQCTITMIGSGCQLGPEIGNLLNWKLQ